MADSPSTTPEPGTAAEKSVQLPFRFQLGERTLFKVTRELRSRNATLAQILDDRLPPLDLSGGGMIYRSLPAERAAAIGEAAGGLAYVRQFYPRYFADLSGDFESYLAGLSSNTRSQLKRKMKAFEKHSGGPPEIREFRDPAALGEFFALAREVSSRTYQERLLNAGLPDNPAFRAAAEQRAAADNLRAYILFDAGRPISYLYLPVREGVVLYEYVGYDPDLAHLSPGTVLQFEAMRRLFAEGRYRYFDFTVGDGQHKRQFSTGMVECVDLVILPPTPANRLLIGAHRAFNRSVEQAGALVDRWGLKARVRRLLRGQ